MTNAEIKDLKAKINTFTKQVLLAPEDARSQSTEALVAIMTFAQEIEANRKALRKMKSSSKETIKKRREQRKKDRDEEKVKEKLRKKIKKEGLDQSALFLYQKLDLYWKNYLSIFDSIKVPSLGVTDSRDPNDAPNPNDLEKMSYKGEEAFLLQTIVGNQDNIKEFFSLVNSFVAFLKENKLFEFNSLEEKYHRTFKQLLEKDLMPRVRLLDGLNRVSEIYQNLEKTLSKDGVLMEKGYKIVDSVRKELNTILGLPPELIDIVNTEVSQIEAKIGQLVTTAQDEFKQGKSTIDDLFELLEHEMTGGIISTVLSELFALKQNVFDTTSDITGGDLSKIPAIGNIAEDLQKQIEEEIKALSEAIEEGETKIREKLAALGKDLEVTKEKVTAQAEALLEQWNTYLEQINSWIQKIEDAKKKVFGISQDLNKIGEILETETIEKKVAALLSIKTVIGNINKTAGEQAENLFNNSAKMLMAQYHEAIRLKGLIKNPEDQDMFAGRINDVIESIGELFGQRGKKITFVDELMKDEIKIKIPESIQLKVPDDYEKYWDKGVKDNFDGCAKVLSDIIGRVESCEEKIKQQQDDTINHGKSMVGGFEKAQNQYNKIAEAQARYVKSIDKVAVAIGHLFFAIPKLFGNPVATSITNLVESVLLGSIDEAQGELGRLFPDEYSGIANIATGVLPYLKPQFGAVSSDILNSEKLLPGITQIYENDIMRVYNDIAVILDKIKVAINLLKSKVTDLTIGQDQYLKTEEGEKSFENFKYQIASINKAWDNVYKQIKAGYLDKKEPFIETRIGSVNASRYMFSAWAIHHPRKEIRISNDIIKALRHYLIMLDIEWEEGGASEFGRGFFGFLRVDPWGYREKIQKIKDNAHYVQAQLKVESGWVKDHKKALLRV